MGLTFTLLKHIGKAALNVIGGGIAGDVIVEWLPQVAKGAWESWSKERDEQQRRIEMESIVQSGVEQIRQEIAEVKQAIAADKSPEIQLTLESYLTQVPAMIQRSLRRPSDPSGTTVPTSLVPRKAEDLLQFLPPKMPRFKKGDHPLPGVDLELEQLLGVGGFGEVWKARNPHMTSSLPVALKFCLDASAAKALRNETALLDRVMQQRRLTGIVQLKRTYLSAETPCLEYEYVEGGDLTGFIREWHQKKGGLSPVLVGKVMLQLAKTLESAHRLNPAIVHRDLKPANILVQRLSSGLLFKIADFGIGGIASDQAIKQANKGVSQAFHMTSVASGSCTPLYASPQQMRGGLPDPRDDVFSLGVIWYQMLTGDLANGRPGGTLWHRRLVERGVTSTMADLLASCFEERPEDRPADAGVLASALATILQADQLPKQTEHVQQPVVPTLPVVGNQPYQGQVEQEDKRTRKREEVRQHSELEHQHSEQESGSHAEGEKRLSQFIRDALDRTGGKLGHDDEIAFGELCRSHSIPFERAKQILRQVRNIWSKQYEARTAQAQQLANSASAYLGKNEFDRALADSTQAIRLDPECLVAYRVKAEAYRMKKEFDRAIENATSGIQLVADNVVLDTDNEGPMLYMTRAEAYRMEQQFDEAIADFTEALRLGYPDLALVYFLRGYAFAAKLAFRSAISDFKEALRLKPNDPEFSRVLEEAIRDSKEWNRTTTTSCFNCNQKVKVDLCNNGVTVKCPSCGSITSNR